MNRRQALKFMASAAAALAVPAEILQALLPEGRIEFKLFELESMISELGLFADPSFGEGQLIARHTFDSPVLKRVCDHLDITYDLELSDEDELLCRIDVATRDKIGEEMICEMGIFGEDDEGNQEG